MMQHERRLCTRKTLNPLPYINLPCDNGGIVLDVSEQGLRFRAAAPVEQSGPIHFSFSAHSSRIAGIADLVWTDEAKKIGGLRFTQLADDARETIRKWPHESHLRLDIGKDFTVHIPASDDSSNLAANGRGVSYAIPLLDRLWPKRSGSTLRASQRPALKDGVAELSAPLLESQCNERNRGLIKAISVTVAVIMISMLSYMHHRQAGEWLVSLGTRVAGESHPQTITQTPASNLSLQAPGAGDTSAEKLNVGSRQEQATPQSANAAMRVIAKQNASGPPAVEAPAADVRLQKPAAPGRKLVVQVAALTREADARKLADNLRRESFQASVRTLPVDAFYRVVLGPYADEESARLAVGKLKKAGFNPFIRREPIAEWPESARIATR